MKIAYHILVGIVWGIWMAIIASILYYVYNANIHLASIDLQMQTIATVEDIKSLK